MPVGDYDGDSAQLISSLGSSQSMLPVVNMNPQHHHLSMENKPDEVNADSVGGNKYKRFLHFVRSLTIEPLMFIFMFAFFARSVCVTNLFMEKVCKFRLNYSAEVCDNLTNYLQIKEEVEEITNDYTLYNALILMGPGAFSMLFIGPWSNKYGRKPPLIIVILGVFVDDAILIVNTVYMEAPIEYMLLASVLSGLTGNFTAVKTLINSMGSDVTPKSERTFKFALLEFSSNLGVALGILAGGYLFDTKYTYYSVFGLTVIGNAVCVPWALLVVKETRGLDAKDSWTAKLKDLFTCTNFVDGFRSCLKVRENYGRCQIFMLLASMCAITVTYEAFAEIGYLYAFHIYGWDVTAYSKVNTAFIVSGLFVSVISVPLFRRLFRMGDAGLGFIGTLSIVGKNVMTAFAENRKWLYYTSGLVGAFSGMSIMAVRARLSKLVANDEVVKVFIFLSACESVIPLAGKIAISKTYNLTLDFFPGIAYLVGAAILVVSLITFGWMLCLKDNDYVEMKGSKNEEH